MKGRFLIENSLDGWMNHSFCGASLFKGTCTMPKQGSAASSLILGGRILHLHNSFNYCDTRLVIKKLLYFCDIMRLCR